MLRFDGATYLPLLFKFNFPGRLSNIICLIAFSFQMYYLLLLQNQHYRHKTDN